MTISIPITTTAPRARFLAVYRALLVDRYPWAGEAGRLKRFMGEVERTLNGEASSWYHTGPLVLEAWRALGHKGRPTLKALRAL